MSDPSDSQIANDPNSQEKNKDKTQIVLDSNYVKSLDLNDDNV